MEFVPGWCYSFGCKDKGWCEKRFGHKVCKIVVEFWSCGVYALKCWNLFPLPKLLFLLIHILFRLLAFYYVNDCSFAHLLLILLLHYLVKCRSWILAVYNNELIQAVHASSKKIIVRSQNFWQSVIYLVKSSARLIFLRKFFKKPL